MSQGTGNLVVETLLAEEHMERAVSQRAPRLAGAGRAFGWLGVVLTWGAAFGSAWVLVGHVRDAGSVPAATAWVLAWLTLAFVPLAIVAVVAAERLRFMTTPTLALPTVLLVVGAIVTSWTAGLWLLVPAGAMFVSSFLLQSRD